MTFSSSKFSSHRSTNISVRDSSISGLPHRWDRLVSPVSSVISRVSNFAKKSQNKILRFPEKASEMSSLSKSFTKSKIPNMKTAMKQRRVQARSFVSSCASKLGFVSSGIGQATSLADTEVTPLVELSCLSELGAPTDTNGSVPVLSASDPASALKSDHQASRPLLPEDSVPCTDQRWGQRASGPLIRQPPVASDAATDTPIHSTSQDQTVTAVGVNEHGTAPPVTGQETPIGGTVPSCPEISKSSMASRLKQKWNASSMGSRTSAFTKSCKKTYSSVVSRINAGLQSRPLKQSSSIWSSRPHLRSAVGMRISGNPSHSSHIGGRLSGLRDKYRVWRTSGSVIIPQAEPSSIYDPNGAGIRPHTVLST